MYIYIYINSFRSWIRIVYCVIIFCLFVMRALNSNFFGKRHHRLHFFLNFSPSIEFTATRWAVQDVPSIFDNFSPVLADSHADPVQWDFCCAVARQGTFSKSPWSIDEVCAGASRAERSVRERQIKRQRQLRPVLDSQLFRCIPVTPSATSSHRVALVP